MSTELKQPDATLVAEPVTVAAASVKPDAYEALEASNKPKRTTRQCRTIAAFLLFIVVNVVVSYVIPHPSRVVDQAFIQSNSSEARQQGKWTWWVTRNYLNRTKAPDIAIFGSSQMGSAVFAADAVTLNKVLDCVTHRRGSTLEKAILDRTGRKVDTFNFSMGGSMASDAFMISKALFKGDKKPRMVVVGVNPRDFIDNTLPSVSSTEPFNFFAPFVELGSLANCAFPDAFGHMAFSIKEDVPLLRIHEMADAAAKTYQQQAPQKMTVIPQASEHKSLLRAVLGSADEVRLNEWLLPPNIPAWTFEDNSKEYLTRFKNPRPAIYAAEKAFFTEFLINMEKEGIPVLVVGMPSLNANRSILPNDFWTEFRSTLSTMCNEHHAKWTDQTDNPNFVIEDYLDTVHLNARGGQKIFSKVADVLTQDPDLVSVIKSDAAPGSKISKSGSTF